jgi:hypothetical protein
VAVLSQRAFARLADVSHQAIGKALRAGHLVDEAGRLDPDEATNAAWLARHRDGLGSGGQVYLPTHQTAVRDGPDLRNVAQIDRGDPGPRDAGPVADAGIPASPAPEAPSAPVKGVCIMHTPSAVAPRAGSTEILDGDAPLFSDWTALAVDRDAADRLLREVPAERVDQIAFL